MMNQKNDSIESLATASLMTVASELFSNHHIITLPKGAKYTFQTIIMTLLHAATSVNNSLESASNDLKLKSFLTKIPSADTIFNYINCNNVEYILSSFRAMNRDIFKSMNIKGKVHDIAIDFHNIPFYGDENTPLISGIKPKNGSAWGYSYCTLDIIGDVKLTLDVIAINGFNKNYFDLITFLFERLEKMQIKVGTVYLDKEFCNDDTISALTKLNINFVIAAKRNPKIMGILDNFKKENGPASTVFEYNFNKNGTYFNLVATHDDEKGYILFATNKDVKSIEIFEKSIPEEYRKRWNIETGYRVKNNFKIRTCTKSPIARTLFFVIQCTLHNILNMLKSVLEITAYELKSLINEDIIKVIRYGLKSLYIIPFKLFLNYLNMYNKTRKRDLRNQLLRI
ncbi:Mobile element protein [Methanosarcina lacustris Z-7289]|uniref:Mobile element protein n=2 Tax=Methanosarcina lacustris TaxID=170861 RepID=A0A0E3S181_9EURY|nr:Mobile element protein [Methanosarcina lacustris Z-7289]